jgi:aryl-alcohol dehydrogenase-like predicted oxidoreductase
MIDAVSKPVSLLCLGTMTFGTPVGEPEAIALVHRAIELGINFFDTANIYEGYAREAGSPGGVAETILGKALQGRRDKVLLATKAGNAVGAGQEDRGLSRTHLRRELQQSLQRLQTAAVDIFYLHRPDASTSFEETVATCAELIDEGKIRSWGVSNFEVAQVSEVLAVCDRLRVPRPEWNQAPLSLLKPQASEALLPLCAREGISTVAYQVLQGGLLSGKYVRGLVPSHSRAMEKPQWLPPLDDALFDRLEAFEKQAGQRHQSLLEYALHWALWQPSVVSVAVGVKTRPQLETLWKAVQTPVT